MGESLGYCQNSYIRHQCNISHIILTLTSMLAVRELDVPGELYERKTYPFEFSTVEMPYETYNGVNVRLRYAIMQP